MSRFQRIPLFRAKGRRQEALQKAAEAKAQRAAARAARKSCTEQQRRQAEEYAEQQRQQDEEQKRQLAEQRRQQKQAQTEALSATKAAKELAKAKLQRRVDELKRGVHQNRNLFDRDYRLNLVESYQDEILTKLYDWTKEYDELVQNRQLVAAAAETSP